MYMDRPSNELEEYIVWRTFHHQIYELAEDQVRTVVMDSVDINDNIHSF